VTGLEILFRWEAEIRKSDVDGRNRATIVNRPTKTEESESIYVLKLCHAAKIYTYPCPCLPRLGFLTQGNLARLKQYQFILAIVIQEFD
jgi:hypothetical protein